jgi:1-deoxy-D-xylulose-5-phosphate reductoisomerase
MATKGITILGSTGSIGISTLDIISCHPEKFHVVALTANTQVENLYQQCLTFRPQYAVMSDAFAAKELKQRLSNAVPETKVLSGKSELEIVAVLPEVDIVMAAIVGAVGLLPTLAAVKAGKRLLLANKEALVMSGAIFMNAVHQSEAQLLPIDSEHNALFQCYPADFTPGMAYSSVQRILLTASGGAFRDIPFAELSDVTPEQACTHPNWNMGRKITVDSATMMNKALEVIEAHWLFGLPAEKIEVLLHPQSTVHSLVEYIDGSMLTQLGNPDMRVPISYALAWPERIVSGVSSLDLITLGKLDFKRLDRKRYPCLNLAYQALAAGGTSSTLLNAANEIAVQTFLAGQIKFTEIFSLIEEVLTRIPSRAADTVEVILEADLRARELALKLCEHKAIENLVGSSEA